LFDEVTRRNLSPQKYTTKIALSTKHLQQEPKFDGKKQEHARAQYRKGGRGNGQLQLATAVSTHLLGGNL